MESVACVLSGARNFSYFEAVSLRIGLATGRFVPILALLVHPFPPNPSRPSSRSVFQ